MLRLPIRLLIILLLLTFTTSVWGRPTPPVPLQAFFADCDDVEVPCWYGLWVGYSYIEDFDAVLTEAGYTATEEGTRNDELYRHYAAPDDSELCDARVYYSSGDSHIIWISLSECGEFYLADVLLHFGTPRFMGMLREGNGWLHYGQGVEVSFSGGLTPDSLVTGIVINPPWEGGPYLDWRGYIPFWMHCLLDPYYENCWMES